MSSYRTPGVIVEEVSNGARPIQSTSTTDTGFLAVFKLPDFALHGEGLRPLTDTDVQAGWNRAVAFAELDAPKDSKLNSWVQHLLAGAEVVPPKAHGERMVLVKVPSATADTARKAVEDAADAFRKVSTAAGKSVNTAAAEDVAKNLADAETAVFAAKRAADAAEKARSLEWAADPSLVITATRWEFSSQATPLERARLVHSLRKVAERRNVAPSTAGGIGLLPKDDAWKALRGIWGRGAERVLGASDFETRWKPKFAHDLFLAIKTSFGADPSTPAQAEDAWNDAGKQFQGAWNKWVALNPGMKRLEIAVRGFFEAGGRVAYLAVGFPGVPRPEFLGLAFNRNTNLALLAAPGLGFTWQQAILQYAGSRRDLFAVLDTPRWLCTAERSAVERRGRWELRGAAGDYEVEHLETLARPELSELPTSDADEDVFDGCTPRDNYGYGAAYAPWIIVDNPFSTGADDRYVVAPPSGHVAGMIVATDLRAGGGVQKAPANEIIAGVHGLVADLSDTEQEPLNERGVNVIRRRPFAGIRVWGARTVASDSLWRYVNVRRLFLMVERSISRDVDWAVFQPNTYTTRLDLRGTIAGYLFRLWQEGKLDGRSHTQAYSVKCDEDNNPDTNIRSGILTVDIELRPVYPAEFIRLRFRQTPMTIEVIETTP